MTDQYTLETIAGAGGCFRAGTQVQLEHGKTIAIEKLKVGDEILAFDEAGTLHRAKVVKVHFHADPQPILRVRFWRGETYITPNHWVLNQYHSFVEMGSLTTHDAVVDGMGHLRPIIGAELVGYEPVWNLTVEPHHTFIADGIRVHNGGHRERFPTVAGSGGGGGKGGGGGRPAVEDPDSLQSRAMVSLLDLLGEGEIGGLVDGAKSIFLDNTPLMNASGTYNFTGVTWEQRTGTQSQSPIAGFNTVETPHVMNVKATENVSPVFTIDNPNADAVRIVVMVPTLIKQDMDDGDVHGTTVEYKFQISTDGGAFKDLSDKLAISGKTRSRYNRSHQFNLPKPATYWTVRMVRITKDSTSGSLQNEIYLDSYSEIVESKLSYPNSALVGIKIDSSQFSSIPQRSYLVDGLFVRVPANYDAAKRTYTGTWDGTFKVAVSSNPAWILYDLLTNKRYGLGEYIDQAQIDKAKLYQIGRYCDELVSDGFGGQEPRFAINTCVQTQAEAYRLIADICSAFRGMAFWTGGQVAFMQDAPADPVMVFNSANVVDGMFNYAGSARKDRHSVVLVTWNDPSQNYKQMVEYVEDPELVARFGLRKLETVAFGCTSRGQAHRAGRWILYTEAYESDMVTFNVGLDSALLLPGDIIKIHDATRAGKRMGGRLKSCTTTSAVLDAPVTLTSTAKISIRMPDGSFEERMLAQSKGEHTTVSWSVPLPATPVPNAIWLVAEENLVPMLARVIGVSQTEDPGVLTVTAVEHNPSKFDAIEKNLKLEEPKVSIIDASALPTVSGWNVTEAPAQLAPGVMGLNLYVSWSGTGAMSYEITWRRSGKYQTNPVSVFSTAPVFDIENARAGTYYFTVVGVSALGKRSRPLTFEHTTLGRTAAPGAVSNFRIKNRTSDLLLEWDQVTDIAVKGYEIRVGQSWDAGTVITTNFAGTMITHDQDYAGTYTYHIKSIDQAGQYSEDVTSVTLVLPAPTTVAGFDCVQNGTRIEFRWNQNPEKDIVGYEIREGSTWSSATFVTQLRATTYSMPANANAGTRTFWIKAIASPGIYSDVAAWASTEVAAQQDRNVVFTDDEKAYGWLGSKYNVSVVGDTLQLENGQTYGEYTWGVSLPKAYRARNSIQSTFDAALYDDTSWKTATFKWQDNQATRAWVTAGDATTVDLNYYISKYQGIDSNTIEAFGLNAQTAGESGTRNAAQAVGLTYDAGRFLKGVVMGDFARLNWNVPVPAVFNVTFWAIPKGAIDGNQVYWSAVTASGLQLLCGYDASARAFYLEDTQGQKLTLPFDIALQDRILIGIAQTSTTRRLLVGKLNGSTDSVEGAHAPIGELANVRLHQ